MKTVPFWTEDYPAPRELGAAEPPPRVDVAVVGAGVTGLMAARRLALQGASVAVFESGPVGAGASTVNGGMTIYGLKLDTEVALQRYGDLGREMFHATNDAVDLVADVVAAEGIACDHRRTGSLMLGMRNGDRKAFPAESDWLQRELGFSTRVVAPGALRSEIGSDAFTIGLVEDFSAGLHPAKYTYGLAAAAERHGVALVAHAPVAAITNGTPRFEVVSARGTTQADTVVVATNGYTGSLTPRLASKIVPIGSYIVVTEPLDEATADEIIPHERMVFTARRLINYFRLTPDRRLLMGGRPNLRTDLDLDRSAGYLRKTIDSFFPQLREVAITHSWTGKLGATFDLMPHIGRHDGVWYAAGYSGHGVAVGSYLGDELGRLLGGEINRSPFAEIPHPGRWYYRRRPWFLSPASWMFRLLDRFGK